MGSIPVRSTKKHRMQICIRCFLVLFLVNPSLVRQYGKAVFLPRVSRLRETAKPYNSNNERQKNTESIINPRIIPEFDKNKSAYYP